MKPSPIIEVTLTGDNQIILPESIAHPFYKAGHKRIKVIATYKQRSLTIYVALNYRNGLFTITFGQRYQKELKYKAAEIFTIQVLEDTSKYGVEMPEEFEAVLEGDWEARQLFEKLTPGKKRSLIYFVSRFKNVQTRVDKSLIIAENLKRNIQDTQLLIKHL